MLTHRPGGVFIETFPGAEVPAAEVEKPRTPCLQGEDLLGSLVQVSDVGGLHQHGEGSGFLHGTQDCLPPVREAQDPEIGW